MITDKHYFGAGMWILLLWGERHVIPPTELTFLLFSSGSECSSISANALSVVLLRPVDVLLSLRYVYTDPFRRTTLAEAGRLGLRLSFPEPYEACNLKISSPPRKQFRIRKYTTKSIRRHFNVNSKFTLVLLTR